MTSLEKKEGEGKNEKGKKGRGNLPENDGSVLNNYALQLDFVLVALFEYLKAKSN